MDTYLMKNNEKIKYEGSHTQFPQPRHNPGGDHFRGQGKGGGFGRGRVQIICYNCRQLEHYARYFTSPTQMCSYYKVLNNNIEEFPHIIAKWKAKVTGTQKRPPNANQNVQKISVDP